MAVEQQRQGSLQPLHQQQHELAQPLPIFHDGWPDSNDSDLYASAMETHRLFMRDEREDIQKKTFSKWINSRLSRAGKSTISDLVSGLQDGTHLLALLEVLSGFPLHPERGHMRLHHLNNVNKALRFITEPCNIKLVNISPDDIVDGNAKLILGLVWSIILHWQVKSSMQSAAAAAVVSRTLASSGAAAMTTGATSTILGQASGGAVSPVVSTADGSGGSSTGQSLEQTLLAWCRQATAGYAGVNVRDLSTSFRDGLAFNAIIHRYRPDLFDFADVASTGDAECALANAFQVAHDQLGIDRLLDPEDMMVPNPDKKSVMMYLTCLFQALPHTEYATSSDSRSVAQRSANQGSVGVSLQHAGGVHRRPSAAGESSAVPPKVARRGSVEQRASDYSPSSSSVGLSRRDSDRVTKVSTDASERDSLASSVGGESASESSSIISVVSSIHDVASFTQCLETTLAWLLGARETFDKMEPVADDVEVVKRQFRVHEDYLVELTKYQENVGALLQKGNELIGEGELTPQQEQEARSQIELLNRQWEDLRVHATERQSRLQHALMELQQAQLDELSAWLTGVELRISTYRPIGENLDEVKRQVEEHKKLQEELETHQAQINSLQNMVVVVEDAGTDASCLAMETQLEQIGYRWADICKWTEDQWLLLQDVSVKWNAFKKEKDDFDAWLSSKEEVLGHMQFADVTDPRILVQQVQQLKSIEHGMDEQMQHYDVLNRLGQSLVNYLAGFPQTALKIQSHLDGLKERWDNLVRQMEAQSKRIAQSGVDPAKVAAAAAAAAASVTPSSSLAGPRAADQRATTGSHAASLSSSATAAAYISGEFAELHSSFCEWLERTASSLALLTTAAQVAADVGIGGDHESNEEEQRSAAAAAAAGQLSVEEQLMLVRDVADDVCTHGAKTWAKLTKLASSPLPDGSGGSPARRAGSDLEVLEKRWQSLRSLLARTEAHVMAAAEVEQVTDELHSLQESLASYQRWLSSAPPHVVDGAGGEAPEIARHLDQCRVKLKAMGAHEKRVETIYEKREALLKMDLPQAAPLAEKVVKLYNEWQSTVSQISVRQQTLSLKMNQAPPKKYLDAVDALLKWIKEVEDMLVSEKAYACEVETMEGNLAQYKEVQDAVKEHSIGLEYINKTGRELVEKTLSADRATALREQLHSLNARWDEVSRQVELRVVQLQADLDDQRLLRNQLSGLSRWMSDMDQFLRAEQPLLGDTEALEAQLRESDGALDDVRTLQATVEDVARLCARLSERAEPAYAEQLRAECALLDERWRAVCAAAQQQNANLKAALAKNVSLTEGMSSLTEYLSRMESEVSLTTEFNTLGDLQNAERKLKKLYSEVCSREELLQVVKATSDEMLSQSRSTSLPRLVNRVRLLENKLKTIKGKLEDGQNTCSVARTNWDELIALLRGEYDWLEKLQKKLRSPRSSAAVDAEEVSEEMDDLENCVENHSEESHLRIKDLAKYFLERNILASEAETKLKEYESMYSSNVSQARDRIAHLEKSVQQMQTRDAQAATMEVWMKEVSGHLRRWRDQDLLAADLPKEFQTLLEEFSERDKFLASLDEQIEEYRRLGKPEAADRLATKAQALRAEYELVLQNFNRFQRPADFDNKFDKVIRQLSDIDSKIFLVELHEETPDHVQSRLEQCNKFYRTMSEMKQEVEYIIKAGRQVVEKKQVDFPNKLSQQLDAAKQQYNDLGAQITQAKRNLEKALKVSKKLAREMTAARETVDQLEAAASATPTAAQSLSGDVRRCRAALDQARELLRQLGEYTEEGALESAQGSLAELERRLADVATHVEQPSPATDVLVMHSVIDYATPSPSSPAELTTTSLTLQHELTVMGTSGGSFSAADNPSGCQPPAIASASLLVAQVQPAGPEPDLIACSAAANMLSAAPPTPPLPSIVLSVTAAGAEQLVEQQLQNIESALMTKSADRFLLEPTAVADPVPEPTAGVPLLTTSIATKRDSTADRWQRYEALTERSAAWLTELERKLAMATPADACLLKEIEAEIARRQVDINSLNDEVEILTERDTPPMDRKLLLLNQRWVAIRAHFAALGCPSSSSGRSSSDAGVVVRPSENVNGMLPSSAAAAPPMSMVRHEYASLSRPQLPKAQHQQQQQGDVSTEQSSQFRQAAAPDSNAAVRDLDAMIESLRRYPEAATSAAATFSTSPVAVAQQPQQLPPLPLRVTSPAAPTADAATSPIAAFATTAGRRFSVYAGTFVDEIRTLLQQINILQQQLDASQITPNEYTRENFSSSGDILKSIWQTMAALSGTIGDAEAQHGSVLSSQDCHDEEAQSVRAIMQRLRAEWAHINADYVAKNKDFQETCALWQRYQNEYRSLSQWLDATEKTLRRSRAKSPPATPSGSTDPAVGSRGTNQELEDDVRQHEADVDILCALASQLAAHLHVEEAERFINRLDALVTRWKSVQAELEGRRAKFTIRLRCLQWKHWLSLVGNARLQSLDKDVNIEKLLESIDDLMFWCDETEVLITTGHVNLDLVQLADQLQKVKVRLAELPTKAGQLGTIVAQLRGLLRQRPQLTSCMDSSDLNRIENDLTEMGDKWHKVHKDLRHRQQSLSDVVATLRLLGGEMNTLHAWLTSAAATVNSGEVLQAPSSSQAQLQPDAVVQSAPSIEILSAQYRELIVVLKRRHRTIPQDVEQRFQALTKQCTSLRLRLQQSGGSARNSDSSIEDTLANGVGAKRAAGPDDIVPETPRASALMETCVEAPVPFPSIAAAYSTQPSAIGITSSDLPVAEEGPLPPPRVESLIQASGSAAAGPAGSDSPWLEQRVSAFIVTRLDAVEQLLKSRRVVVGDVEDIMEAQAKIKGATVQLQEAAQQLQALLNGNTLSAEKGATFRQRLDNARSLVQTRQAELERMLTDSRRLQTMASELQGALPAAATASGLSRWQEGYDALAHASRTAAQAYANDDTSHLQLRLDGLSEQLGNMASRRQHRAARDAAAAAAAAPSSKSVGNSNAADTGSSAQSSGVSADEWATVTATCQRLIDWLESGANGSSSSSGHDGGIRSPEEINARRGEVEHVLSTGRACLVRDGQRLSAASSCDGSSPANGLAGDHGPGDTIKRMAKDARRRLRQLSAKWADAIGSGSSAKEGPTDGGCGDQPSAAALTTANTDVAALLEELEAMVGRKWRPVGDLVLAEVEGELYAAKGVREKLSEVRGRLESPRDADLNKEKVDQRRQRVAKLCQDVDARIKELECASRDFAPPLKDMLSGSVRHPYERTVTTAGVPYYINHETKKTQWDHPAMGRLLESLAQHKDVKFSAYRTALKLRTVQRGLGLDSVALHTAAHAFELHKLDARNDRYAGVDSISACLRTIFESEDEHRNDQQRGAGSIEAPDVPLRIDLTLNWLLNVYDLSRHGCMRVLSFKAAIVLMSRAPVEEKFKYLFRSLDSSSRVDQRSLSYLLGDCLQLPRHVGEGAAFGTHSVDASVRSCMEQTGNEAKGSIDVDHFLDWLRLEPQSLVWIDVFHRVAASEKCTHNVKCSICKASPIVGLRYRCLRCFNFSLCQACFFAGKRAKKHSLAHPMKEYYSTTTSNDEMKDSTSPLKKKYSSGRYIRKHQPKGYLPVKAGENDSSSYSLGSTPLSSPAATLRANTQLLNVSMPEVNGKKESLRSEDIVISTACSPSKSMSSQDIHVSISQLAQQLDAAASVGGSNQKTSTPRIGVNASSETDDEHAEIARLCGSLTCDASVTLQSPTEIVRSVESSQKLELEAMIRDLELENRNLQEEYDRLRLERDSQPPMYNGVNGRHTSGDGSSLDGASAAEMLAEARQLRQHKSRLEARMQILEEHNRQLESQLMRLRHLLVDGEETGGSYSASDGSMTQSISLPTEHDTRTALAAVESMQTTLPPAYDDRRTGVQPSLLLATDSVNLRGKQQKSNVSELFQRAGDIGKALGSLVNTVTSQDDVH